MSNGDIGCPKNELPIVDAFDILSEFLIIPCAFALCNPSGVHISLEQSCDPVDQDVSQQLMFCFVLNTGHNNPFLKDWRSTVPSASCKS